MTEQHIIMLEEAKNLMNNILSGNEVDVSELRNAVNDVQTVINENQVKSSNAEELIYKFEDYFPRGGGDGPGRTA